MISQDIDKLSAYSQLSLSLIQICRIDDDGDDSDGDDDDDDRDDDDDDGDDDDGQEADFVGQEARG